MMFRVKYSIVGRGGGDFFFLFSSSSFFLITSGWAENWLYWLYILLYSMYLLLPQIRDQFRQGSNLHTELWTWTQTDSLVKGSFLIFSEFCKYLISMISMIYVYCRPRYPIRVWKYLISICIHDLWTLQTQISIRSLNISYLYMISMIYGHCRPRYPSGVWIYLISI